MLKTEQKNFYSSIRALERLYNVGVTTRYDKDKDMTYWILGSRVVGFSGGVVGDSKHYKLLENV